MLLFPTVVAAGGLLLLPTAPGELTGGVMLMPSLLPIQPTPPIVSGSLILRRGFRRLGAGSGSACSRQAGRQEGTRLAANRD